MEILGRSHLFGAGADHDLLCRDRRLDHQIRGGVSHRPVVGRCAGRLFYRLYHLLSFAGGVCPALYGRYGLYRVQRRGGRHRARFPLYDARFAGAGGGDRRLLAHPQARGCFRPAAHRSGGPALLPDSARGGAHHRPLFADPAGCHEPDVLLPQRFHGHYDHLRLLCKAGGEPEQGREPDRNF